MHAASKAAQSLIRVGFTQSRKGSIVISATGVKSFDVYITGIFTCSGVVTMLFRVGVRKCGSPFWLARYVSATAPAPPGMLTGVSGTGERFFFSMIPSHRRV